MRRITSKSGYLTRLQTLFVLSVLLASFAPNPAHGQDAESLTETFLLNAPPKWREYLALCRRLQGTITVDFTASREGEVHSTWREEFEIRQGDAGALLRTRRVGEWERISGSNWLYAFEIAKTDAEKAKTAGEKTWQIRSLSQWKHKNPPQLSEKDPILRYSAAPVYISGMNLPALLKDEGFTLLAVKGVNLDGKRLVKTFDLTGSSSWVARQGRHFNGGAEESQVQVTPQDNFMILDPENYWCIREYRTTGTDPSDTSSAKIELATKGTEFPIVSRMAYEDTYANKVWHRKSETVFKLTPRDPANEELLISQFGFPEPKFAAPKSGAPVYLWLALGAVSIVAAGVGARLLRTKATSSGDGKKASRCRGVRRVLAYGLVLAGVGLFAAAAYLYFTTPSQPSVVVEEANIDIGDFLVGDEIPVTFRFHNRASRPMRVLGIVPIYQGGLDFNQDIPVEYPPGVSELKFSIKSSSPGTIRRSLPLYVEDIDDIRFIVLTVDGVAYDE
ncbi:MAG: hypothetical protein HY040_06525 [Planctomycetes bacterium]|nr:hypothetical protein [Planctomycetota bacterium]